MEHTLFTLDDLLKRLSALVTDAVAPLDLSNMDGADRDTFLRGVTGRTVNTFWKTYVETLPANVQQPLHSAIEQNDTEALTAWYAQYANFVEDVHARELAESILTAMTKALPKQIKYDFAAFNHVTEYA